MKRNILINRMLLTVSVASLMLLSACDKKSTDNNTKIEQEALIVQDIETNEDEAELVEENESIENLILKTSLKDIYAQHGIKAGTCLSESMINNKKTEDILLAQFNSVTLENAMKPDAILKRGNGENEGQIVVEFGRNTIRLLDWAKEHDMSVRGHTLIWYSQTPDWIFYEDFDTSKELVSRDVMLNRMESYISQVFTRLSELGYSDLIYAYDVVNEAWMEDGTMRDNYWKQTIGEDYLWYAFKYARQYAPENVELYYNDYNEQYKAEALESFIETLVDEDGNYLIDGIGLQAHLYTQDDMTKYFNAVDKLSETGLKISVTELDVALGAWQHTLEANDKNLEAQGKFYYNFIKSLMERKDLGRINMDSITYWGYVDSLSWRKEASPLLYDGDCCPKPAYWGAAQVDKPE